MAKHLGFLSDLAQTLKEIYENNLNKNTDIQPHSKIATRLFRNPVDYCTYKWQKDHLPFKKWKDIGIPDPTIKYPFIRTNEQQRGIILRLISIYYALWGGYTDKLADFNFQDLYSGKYKDFNWNEIALVELPGDEKELPAVRLRAYDPEGKRVVSSTSPQHDRERGSKGFKRLEYSDDPRSENSVKTTAQKRIEPTATGSQSPEDGTTNTTHFVDKVKAWCNRFGHSVPEDMLFLLRDPNLQKVERTSFSMIVPYEISYVKKSEDSEYLSASQRKRINLEGRVSFTVKEVLEQLTVLDNFKGMERTEISLEPMAYAENLVMMHHHHSAVQPTDLNYIIWRVLWSGNVTEHDIHYFSSILSHYWKTNYEVSYVDDKGKLREQTMRSIITREGMFYPNIRTISTEAERNIVLDPDDIKGFIERLRRFCWQVLGDQQMTIGNHRTMKDIVYFSHMLKTAFEDNSKPTLTVRWYKISREQSPGMDESQLFDKLLYPEYYPFRTNVFTPRSISQNCHTLPWFCWLLDVSETLTFPLYYHREMYQMLLIFGFSHMVSFNEINGFNDTIGPYPSIQIPGISGRSFQSRTEFGQAALIHLLMSTINPIYIAT